MFILMQVYRRHGPYWVCSKNVLSRSFTQRSMWTFWIHRRGCSNIAHISLVETRKPTVPIKIFSPLQAPCVQPHTYVSKHKETGRRENTAQTDVEKMAIIFRSDIRITPGRIMNIATTIAVRLFQSVCSTPNGACVRWNSSGQRKVFLRVSGDNHVQNIIRYARANRIPMACVSVEVGHAMKPSERRVIRPISDKDGAHEPKHIWVALGIFAPSSVIDRMTRGLEPF